MPLLARVPRGRDLALDPAAAEAAGDQDAVGAAQKLPGALALPAVLSRGALEPSESTHSICTRASCSAAAWRSASATER